MRLSSNIIDDDKNNFLRKVLPSDQQVSNLRKVFANNFLVDMKISKRQISKTVHLYEFFSKLIEPLLKSSLPAESLFIPLGLTATPSAANAGILKNISCM